MPGPLLLPFEQCQFRPRSRCGRHAQEVLPLGRAIYLGGNTELGQRKAHFLNSFVCRPEGGPGDAVDQRLAQDDGLDLRAPSRTKIRGPRQEGNWRRDGGWKRSVEPSREGFSAAEAASFACADRKTNPLWHLLYAYGLTFLTKRARLVFRKPLSQVTCSSTFGLGAISPRIDEEGPAATMMIPTVNPRTREELAARCLATSTSYRVASIERLQKGDFLATLASVFFTCRTPDGYSTYRAGRVPLTPPGSNFARDVPADLSGTARRGGTACSVRRRRSDFECGNKAARARGVFSGFASQGADVE